MSAAKLDQVWQPDLLCRMGGAANGGSSKTPQERERLDEEHQGRDLDKPAGSGPAGGAPGAGGAKDADVPPPSRDTTD